MRNLICNCCYSGFLYRQANSKFDSPFFWNRITCCDFIKLMTHFHDIDFSNLSIKSNKDLYGVDTASCLPTNVSIVLDDFNIRVQFNHYKWSRTDLVPRKSKINDYVWDIYYYRNYEYAYNKFVERSKRITNDRKIYVFVDNARQFDSVSDYNNLFIAARDTGNELYFMTADKTIKCSFPSVHIIYCDRFNFESMTLDYFDLFESL